MRRMLTLLVAATALLGLMSVPALAGPDGQPAAAVFPDGCCYYEDQVVRTVVPPAAHPGEGRDNFYGVPGQRGVVGVAPGDVDYHGGDWAFHAVSWIGAPYLLKSEADVLAAEAAGDITVTRMPEKDFLCPLQP
jgi:hypothetical protein